MAFDVEAALITKILELDDARTPVRQKVMPDFFADEDLREVYRWLLVFYQKYGRVPSLSLLQDEYDFEPVDTDDDLLILIDRIKEKKVYSDIQRAVAEVVESTRSNPREGLQVLKAKASSLAAIHSEADDLDLSRCGDDIRVEYERLKSQEGTLGIPFPWDRLNRATLGMHDGELIAFYARPKCMKTWVALYTAYFIHKNFDKVPVFFTKEMPPEQIRRRYAAMACGVDYTAFREGRLTEMEEIRFYDMVDELEERPPFLITTIEGTGPAALTEVKAKCEEYGADVAVVDGLYFMAEDPSWRAFTVITRGLKELARTMKIPVVGTTQANRSADRTRGQTVNEVAFGDSLACDVDLLIRIIREGQHRENDELLMTLPALRESKGCTFTIHAIPATNFSQKYTADGEGQEELEGTDEGNIV